MTVNFSHTIVCVFNLFSDTIYAYFTVTNLYECIKLLCKCDNLNINNWLHTYISTEFDISQCVHAPVLHTHLMCVTCAYIVRVCARVYRKEIDFESIPLIHSMRMCTHLKNLSMYASLNCTDWKQSDLLFLLIVKFNVT